MKKEITVISRVIDNINSFISSPCIWKLVDIEENKLTLLYRVFHSLAWTMLLSSPAEML